LNSASFELIQLNVLLSWLGQLGPPGPISFCHQVLAQNENGLPIILDELTVGRKTVEPQTNFPARTLQHPSAVAATDIEWVRE